MPTPGHEVCRRDADEDPIHRLIAQRARELWEQRGRLDGHAEEDWERAEAEIRATVAGRDGQLHKRLIIVRAGGTVYTAEYDPLTADLYRPADVIRGTPVTIHFQADDLMLIKFADGQALQARIVKKEPDLRSPDG